MDLWMTLFRIHRISKITLSSFWTGYFYLSILLTPVVLALWLVRRTRWRELISRRWSRGRLTIKRHHSLHIMVISRDDQTQGPRLNKTTSEYEAAQIMISSQDRKALPTLETGPVHKSSGRILGFKNCTNHGATSAGARQPGTSQTPFKSFNFLTF